MAAAGNNVFAIRFGLDGADFELIDELNDLIRAARWPPGLDTTGAPGLPIS